MKDSEKQIKDREYLIKIANAGNTWKACLRVLYESGCRLRHDYNEDDDVITWLADFNDRAFVASDPVALLGIFCMWQKFGDNWMSRAGQEEEDEIYGRLMDGETIDKIPR